jgi:lysophospholipase L1-like esterase
VGIYVASHILKDASYRMRFLMQTLAVAFMLLPIINESRYWIRPEFSLNNINRIYVIGDSVSSGLGGPDENTWPMILSDKLNVPVINLAIAGATAQSAMKRQAVWVKESPCMVFMEIGGNDLLNATSLEEFEKSMRQILEELKPVTNRIVWFEIPLLPWKTQYGQIQRKLAKELKITLIPKRILSEVFQSPDTTSDSIHLTAKGHQAMAEKVSRLFESRMK